MGICSFSALQDKRIIVILLLLADLNNLGHMQDVQYIVGATHLSNFAARIKKVVNPSDYLITCDAGMFLDLLDS